MKIIILCSLFILVACEASKKESTASIHLKEHSCETVEMGSDGKIVSRFVSLSEARCELGEAKMTCFFRKQNDKKNNVKEEFYIIRLEDGSLKAQSKNSLTAMKLFLKEERFSYHLTGFREFKNKVATQICVGELS